MALPEEQEKHDRIHNEILVPLSSYMCEKLFVIYDVLMLVLLQVLGNSMTLILIPASYGPRRLRSECLYYFDPACRIGAVGYSNRRHPKADEQKSLPTFPSKRIRIILFNGNKGIDLTLAEYAVIHSALRSLPVSQAQVGKEKWWQ